MALTAATVGTREALIRLAIRLVALAAQRKEMPAHRRGSAEYKRKMAVVYVRRALAEASAKARRPVGRVMLSSDGRGAAGRAFVRERPTTHSFEHLLGKFTLENCTDSGAVSIIYNNKR